FRQSHLRRDHVRAELAHGGDAVDRPSGPARHHFRDLFALHGSEPHLQGPQPMTDTGIWGWRLTKGFTVLVYVFMFAPISVTVLLSFNASQFGGFPMTGFSMHWFGVLMDNDIVLRAFQTSLMIGCLTALICTALGILAAMALVRYEFPGKEWV